MNSFKNLKFNKVFDLAVSKFERAIFIVNIIALCYECRAKFFFFCRITQKVMNVLDCLRESFSCLDFS